MLVGLILRGAGLQGTWAEDRPLPRVPEGAGDWDMDQKGRESVTGL